MKAQPICNITNREFGIGFFIKKESILSSFKYSIYLKILWFKLGFRFAYGQK
jgi:hypothetical protein